MRCLSCILVLSIALSPAGNGWGQSVIEVPASFAEDTARIHALTRKGKAVVFQDPDSALTYFREAMSLAHDELTRAATAESRSMAGFAHYVRGEYDLALPLFIESLNLFRQHNNEAGLSNSYNRIGLIYLIQKRKEEAIAYFRKGVRHGKAASRIDLQASANFNIGLTHDETGNYDSALYYLKIALDQSRESVNAQLILMSLNRTAKVYFHQKQYATALAYYDSVLHHPLYQSNWETSFAQAGLAETYDALGQHDKAIEAGLQSLSLAKEMNARWDMLHVAEILARSYANSDRYKEAYDMALVTLAYKDSVFNEEKESNLNYIQLKESELAKATLEKVNAVQAVKLERRNFQMLMAGVILLSLVGVTVALYSSQRQKTRLNRRLKSVNDQIAQQNDDLRKLNESKNQLLSIISHDMRSPIGNLRALLTLARQGHLNERERSVVFEQLEQNFDAVSATLENLLQWSRVQIEGTSPNPEPVRVSDLVERVKGFWDPALREKSIEFHYAGDDHIVHADPHQLETVVRNVVGNAVKYTPTAGTITVEAVKEDGDVGIVIRDTGIGMPRSIRENLFELRKENQRPGTSREKGSGMGLMISRQLLEKNGGRIEVASEEGKGAAFTLWVPAQ